jgi:hypothetical protein
MSDRGEGDEYECLVCGDETTTRDPAGHLRDHSEEI